MKKNVIIITSILVVLVIALACVFVFNKKENNKAALEFKKEYEALNGKMARFGKPHRTLNIDEDNPYVKVTKEKVVEMLKNKESFYLYVGDPLCPWCRSTIEQSIKSAKENKIDKIYYIDFWDDDTFISIVCCGWIFILNFCEFGDTLAIKV